MNVPSFLFGNLYMETLHKSFLSPFSQKQESKKIDAQWLADFDNRLDEYLPRPVKPLEKNDE